MLFVTKFSILTIVAISHLCFIRINANDNVVEDSLEDAKSEDLLRNTAEDVDDEETEMTKAMGLFELRAEQAARLYTKAPENKRAVKKAYENLIEQSQVIMEKMTSPDNAEDFLKSGGLKKMILPNLSTAYTDIKNQLLVMVKYLLDNHPLLTKETMPTELIDKLTDIFEFDSNIDNKHIALDVIRELLPNNPKIQTRIMIRKGIEPFYNQMNKLGPPVAASMLGLLNKLLVEHFTVINNTENYDPKEVKIYKRMGLVEIISTRRSCNGLLNIIEFLWSHESDRDVILVHTGDLLKTVKAVCIVRLNDKSRAHGLFVKMLQHITDANKESEENNNDIKATLEEYISFLEVNAKDEL